MIMIEFRSSCPRCCLRQCVKMEGVLRCVTMEGVLRCVKMEGVLRCVKMEGVLRCVKMEGVLVQPPTASSGGEVGEEKTGD